MKYNKYYKYLTIKHNWNDINCLTLLELIYKNELNIDLTKIWKKYNTNARTDINARWFIYYSKEILKECSLWNNISINKIKEYDILIFKSRKGLPVHFGMYIDEPNKFIHCMEHCYTCISELDDDYRNTLLGIYRYVV